MMLTVDDVYRFNPCPDYPHSRIVELFGGRETLSLREIAALDIPTTDRMWVLCKARRDRALEWNYLILEEYIQNIIVGYSNNACKRWKKWADAWLSGEDRTWCAANTASTYRVESRFKFAVWYAKDIESGTFLWFRPGNYILERDLEFMCDE